MSSTSNSTTVDPRGQQRAISSQHFRRVLVGHILIVSIASVLLVMKNASVAHFFGSNPIEALLQVGLGSVLIAVWAYIIGGTVFGVVTEILSKRWLLVLPWAVIALFYVIYCPIGYVGDVSEFVQHLQSLR